MAARLTTGFDQVVAAARNEALSAHRSLSVVILDGGFATACEARGMDLRHALWSTKALLDAPSAVRDVHRAFYDAGSDVATVSTYQAFGAGCAAEHVTLGDVARDAVAAARAGADASTCDTGRPKLVAGSLGPLGASLPGGQEYTGAYGAGNDTPDVFLRFHAERIDALLATPCDTVALETFPRLDEAVAVLRYIDAQYEAAATTGVAPRPVTVSFSVAPLSDSDPAADDHATTAGGDSLDAVVAALAPFGFVVAVGCNCCSPRDATRVLRTWHRCRSFAAHGWFGSEADDRYVAWPRGAVLYPNSGERWVATALGTGEWEADEESSAEGRRLAVHWATWQPLLLALGDGMGAAPVRFARAPVHFVGGCCRTTAADIAGLRAAIEVS